MAFTRVQKRDIHIHAKTMRDRDARGIQKKLQKSADRFKERGLYAEADQAQRAHDRMKRETRVPELLPTALMRDLGGVRDPIIVLIKSHHLTVGHGRVVQLLRDHYEGATIDLRSNASVDRIQGGKLEGLEAWVAKRETGAEAWGCAFEAVAKDLWRPVCLVILGSAGIARACRFIGRDSKSARKLLRTQVERAIDGAAAFLGVPT